MLSKKDYDVCVSWVMYSLREVLNSESIRNDILYHHLKKYNIPIHYGKTFGGEYNIEEVKNYLKQIVSYKTPLIFTAANLPDLYTNETHYQSFILDNVKKSLIMIDPARNKHKEGIYEPHISNDVVRPFFEKKKYNVKWLETSNTCQKTESDVFCQSWSLYLQIMAMHRLLETDEKKITNIKIPSKQTDKYKILLDFFVENIHYVPSVCIALKKEYKTNISKNEDFSSIIPKKQLTSTRKKYLKVDPCKILIEMKVTDMFDN
jgi:hypothetical protein